MPDDNLDEMQAEWDRVRESEDYKQAKKEWDMKKKWRDPEEECDHPETDHWVCMTCGAELDPGEAIDRAMDYSEDR